jgi:hypothetical protein
MRHISRRRELEPREVIDDLRAGRNDAGEAERLYRQAQARLKVEIELVKQLSAEINSRREPYSFYDFPSK